MPTEDRNRSSRGRRAAHARGVTIVEVAVGTSVGAVALAVALPVIAQSANSAGEHVSRHNLQVLATAQTLYAEDHQDRQVTFADERQNDVGGSCTAFLSTFGAHPPIVFGEDAGGTTFQFTFQSAGDCSAFSNTWPILFNSGTGSYRLPNTRPLAAYVNGRYWDRTFYAPNDAFTSARAAKNFNAEAEFVDDPNLVELYSSYAWSPAAMWNADVLRGESKGGFQDPEDLPDGFTSPRVSEALFPDLKTRMCEHWWGTDQPSPNNLLVSSDTPYLFNAGIGSRPIAQFFDGSVQSVNTQAAVEDDAAVQADGGDGLWSRDTPFGALGYFGNRMHDDSEPTSFHILTTDGIRGRDFLSVR